MRRAVFIPNAIAASSALYPLLSILLLLHGGMFGIRVVVICFPLLVLFLVVFLFTRVRSTPRRWPVTLAALAGLLVNLWFAYSFISHPPTG